MNARAILSTLRIKTKSDMESEIFRQYMARNLRLISENVAKLSGGSYIQAEYGDIINPKPEDNRSADEIIGSIKEKIDKMNS